MRKKIKQRLTAIICMICVLGSLCVPEGLVSAEETVADITLATAPEGKFEYWTFSDLGILDNTYHENLGVYKTIGATLDKTIFNGKINFPTEVFGNYYLGGSHSWTGFLFTALDNGGLKFRICTDEVEQEICDVTVAKAKGISLRGNSDLQVSISVEYIKEYVESEKTYVDAKVGLFLNGNLYDNQYFEVNKLLKSDLAPGINFRPNAGISYAIASDHLYERSVPDSCENLIYSDLNPTVEEGSGKMNGHLPVNTMDKVLFSAKITLGDMSQLHYGNFDTNGYGGITFYQDRNDKTILKMGRLDGDVPTNLAGHQCSFQVTKALGPTATTFVDVEFRFAMYTEFVDVDGDGRDDLKLGVFFNGKLYDNTFIYIVDAGTDEEIGKRVNSNETAMTWKDYYIKPPAPVSPAANLANITLLDAGVLDGENATFRGGFSTDNLDGTLFSMRIKYTVNKSRFHYGCVNGEGDQNYGGIAFRLDGDTMIIGNELEGTEGEGVLANLPAKLVVLDAELAGVGTTFKNSEFLLQISTEFVDMDSDDAKNDIKLGVFINGALYRGDYFYIKDDAEKLGTDFNFNEGNAALYASHNYQGDFTELTAKNFGLDSKTVYKESYVGTYDDASLDATAITMMLTLPEKKDNQIYIGGAACGVCLTTNDDGTVKLSVVDTKEEEQVIGILTPDSVGLQKLTGTEVKWRFTFRIPEINAEYGRLSLGVVVNGQLYNGQYFTLEQAELASLKRTIAVNVVDSEIKIGEPTYEELTFHDFSVLDTQVTELEEGESITKSNYYDWESLDGTAVSGTYHFSQNKGDRFSFGGAFWEGIVFASGENGQIYVSHVDEEGIVREMAHLTFEKAGVDALLGTDVKVRLTFDIVETSETDADLRLGIYFGEKLYDGKYFTIRNIKQATLTRTCKLYAVNAPYKIESIETPSDLSVYGFNNETWQQAFPIE